MNKKLQITNPKLQTNSNDQNPNDRNKKSSNYDLEERIYQFAKKRNPGNCFGHWSLEFACPVACEALV
ncbi:MAG: hypothetical protein ACE5WD_00510 [Candidatus Aminicenantia bacterium]